MKLGIRSIDQKLPLLMSALVIATVGIFAWTAYAKFGDTLYNAAGRQLENASGLVASLVASSIPRFDQRITAIAAAPAVSRFLATGQGRDEAAGALQPTDSPADSSRVRTQLLDLQGRVVLDHAWQPRVAWADWGSRRIREAAGKRLPFELGPIVDAGSGPEMIAIAPVHASGAASPGTPLGYVLEIRQVSGRNQQTIERLIGASVTMLLGSPHEGVWTDLSGTVSGPPPGVTAGKVIRFNTSARGAGVGLGRRISGTPWMLWMQQSSDQVLSPLTDFLWAIAITGIGITLGGALLVWMFARNMTSRIVRLTDQVELVETDSVADQRHSASARDEIDRLCDAFERMAARINAHTQMETEFRHAQKVDAVGRLAAGVAHDFNNVLMAIQSFAYFQLEELPADSPLRENAEQIYKASTRGAELTKQLLAFTRKKDTARTAVDVAGVTREMTGMLRRLIPKNVEFILETAPDVWPIAADESHLEQVIVNLAVNAKDAMPDGGVLRIEIFNENLPGKVRMHGRQIPAGHYIVLRVSDTGCGMTEAVRSRIFEPFFTTKAEGKGTGLGLSTVYGIVDHWDGYITVGSVPGDGTTFSVYFPRSMAVHGAPTDSTDAANMVA